MVAASHIVCAFVALCGAAANAAPSITYDQRQNGEYNVQVEADGVAVVLLPGGSASDLFDMKKLHHVPTTGDRWQQIFGRRNGVNLTFKKKKPVENCTTKNPEKPYTQSPSVSSSSSLFPSSSSPSPSSSSPYPAESPAPISSPAQENPANVAGSDDVDVRFSGANRPHFIRPGTSVVDPYSVTPDTPDIFPRPETDDDDDDVEDDADDDAAVTAIADSVVETTATVVVEKSAATVTSLEEKKPVQIVSPLDVKTVEKSDNVHAVLSTTTQTIDADAAAVKAEPSSDDKKPAVVEMVAMKTMEKPTVSEPLKVQTKKQQQQPPVDEKPAAEMVAMKTIEKPTTTLVDVAKPAESLPTQADAVKGGSTGPSEAAESRSKPTEMVAVKTVESPGATATTAKSVVTVKTVIRPGSPKTAAPSSNGTSIMRKVGDRKPLPLVTLEVTHPKVVV